MSTKMIYTRNDGWQVEYLYEIDYRNLKGEDQTLRRWGVNAAEAMYALAHHYGWRVGAPTVDAQTRGTLCVEAYVTSQKAGTFFATATLVGKIENYERN